MAANFFSPDGVGNCISVAVVNNENISKLLTDCDSLFIRSDVPQLFFAPDAIIEIRSKTGVIGKQSFKNGKEVGFLFGSQSAYYIGGSGCGFFRKVGIG